VQWLGLELRDLKSLASSLFSNKPIRSQPLHEVNLNRVRGWGLVRLVRCGDGPRSTCLRVPGGHFLPAAALPNASLQGALTSAR